MRIAPLALGLAGIAFVASLAAAQPPGAMPMPRQNAPVTAGPRAGGPEPMPTNLQVLPRDIPHERLIEVMHGFTSAMGQRCGFCHVPGNFASDANPHKNIARGMMRMTAQINRQLLPPIVGASDEMRVTCTTCHRGSPEPATEMPAAAAPGAPAPAAPSAHDHDHDHDHHQ